MMLDWAGYRWRVSRRSPSNINTSPPALQTSVNATLVRNAKSLLEAAGAVDAQNAPAQRWRVYLTPQSRERRLASLTSRQTLSAQPLHHKR